MTKRIDPRQFLAAALAPALSTGAFVFAGLYRPTGAGATRLTDLDPTLRGLILVAAGAAGFGVGRVAEGRPRLQAYGLISGIVVVLATALILSSPALPWVLPLVNFAVCALLTVSAASVQTAGATTSMNIALDGFVSPAQLARFQQGELAVDLKDHELPFTTIFMHIIGLRSILENHQTIDAANALRQLQMGFQEIVHKYGGVAEKSYRNGFVAHFGYQLADATRTIWHADQAFAAAIDLVNGNIRRILQSQGTKQPLFGLKVYIDTGVGYLFNIGTANSPYFGALAPHIDRLQRLRGEGETNCVVITRAAHDSITGNGFEGVKLTTRQLRLEDEELLDCLVFDPMAGNTDLRRQCNQVIRDATPEGRRETRFNVQTQGQIEIFTDKGRGRLENLSRGGLAVSSAEPLPKGATVKINLLNLQKEISQRLERRGMASVEAVIRWQRQENGRWSQGLMYSTLSGPDRNFLLACLLDQLGRHTEPTYFKA